MPKIKMRAWKRRVSHNALHALREAGYRRPRDIADVKVSKLLKIPDIDANDVTTMLLVLYDTMHDVRLPTNFDRSREELAGVIREICVIYGFNKRPKKLLALTAKELLSITGRDMLVLPQMVRKIKHMVLGKPDPEELLKLPPVQKKERRESCWWADLPDAPDISWEKQLRDEEYENQADSSYDCCDNLPVIHRRKCDRKISVFC